MSQDSAGAYHAPPTAAAPPPSGCPVHATWSPLDDDYLADPYPIAARLSEELPFFYAESLGYLVVNRMADIEAVFTDHETFASTNVQDPVFPLSPGAAAVLAAPDFDPVAVMSNRPEPDHGRIRVYTRQGFSNRRLKTLEPYIRTRAGELIDQMLAAGPPAEYVQALAFPLPGETVFRFLGFPEADDERLKSWCQDRKAFSWGHPTPEEQTAIAEKMLAYWRYCREFGAATAENPGDNLTSELIAAHQADEDELTYREVESVVYGLSFAGHEAVTALLCNTLLCLLPRREQWDELVAACAGGNNALINNAVEEVVRFESSQVSWRRVTTKPVTLGGYELPAGTKILMNFAAANRQPDIFDQPHTFDIHRANAGHNISFGKGVHFCLGASLARLEARVVLEELLSRVPTLRLVDGQQIDHFPNITFRGPERLRLTW